MNVPNLAINEMPEAGKAGSRTKRQLNEIMRWELERDRDPMLALWKMIARFQVPWRARFQLTDQFRGDFRSQDIFDGVAGRSLRTATAGMASWLSSPYSDWLELSLLNRELALKPGPRRYLQDTRDDMLAVMEQSNYYAAINRIYKAQLSMGTACGLIAEDPNDTIRLHTYDTGSYSLGIDRNGRVNKMTRMYQMTAGEMAEQFTKEKCSQQVRTAIDGGRLSTYFPVVHCVYPNRNPNPFSFLAKNRKYSEDYYEPGKADVSMPEAMLHEGGYDIWPILAPRWDASTEDIYSPECPGILCLDDVRQLQAEARDVLELLALMKEPPMTGGPGVRENEIGLMAGEYTADDNAQGDSSLRPVFQVTPNIQALMLSIQDLRQQIKESYWVDLFLALASRTTGDRTAREVEELSSEKLAELGPVVDQQADEVHDPSVARIFEVMKRQGKLRVPPPELRGQTIIVRYTSRAAQAQKLGRVHALEQHVGFVAMIAKETGDPIALDTLDTAATIRQHGQWYGVPESINRKPEDIAARVAAREKAQQAAALAQGAPLVARAARDAAEAKAIGNRP